MTLLTEKQLGEYREKYSYQVLKEFENKKRAITNGTRSRTVQRVGEFTNERFLEE